MEANEIEKFLSALRCRKITRGSRWVRSTCPMGHLHLGGVDKKASFAVRINPKGESRCRCQACGVFGPLLQLVWRLRAELGVSRPDLFDFLVERNQLNPDDIPDSSPEKKEGTLSERLRSAPSRKYVSTMSKRESTFVHPDDEPQAQVPEDVLKRMVSDMPTKVLEHLIHNRNLTRQTVVEWELGWHPIERRIGVPIRDEEGKLVSISGRAHDDSFQGPKYIHSPFKRDRVLFGEHRHDPGNRTGYLFEGFFQVIYSWQCGYRNVLANMGTHLSMQQASKLVRWFDRLVIVPDGDVPGRQAAEKNASLLRELELPGRPFDPPGQDETMFKIAEVIVTNMPDGKDADSLKKDKLRTFLGPINSA